MKNSHPFCSFCHMLSKTQKMIVLHKRTHIATKKIKCDKKKCDKKCPIKSPQLARKFEGDASYQTTI
jgi:hypothetical protein